MVDCFNGVHVLDDRRELSLVAAQPAAPEFIGRGCITIQPMSGLRKETFVFEQFARITEILDLEQRPTILERFSKPDE